MKLILIQLFSILVITGCASPYINPTAGELAKIRYINKSGTEFVDAFTFDNHKCENAVLIGSLGKHKYRQEDGINRQGIPMDGIENIESHRIKEIIIPAKKPFVSYIRKSYQSALASSTCSITFSFKPKVNAMYEATYNENILSCWVNLSRLVKNKNDKYIRIKETTFNRNIEQCRY